VWSYKAGNCRDTQIAISLAKFLKAWRQRNWGVLCFQVGLVHPCVSGGRFRVSLFGAQVCLVSLVRRTANFTNEIDQRDQKDQITKLRREMWPGTFSFRPIGGKSLRQYSARPSFSIFPSCARAQFAATACEARRSDATRIGAPNYFCVRSPCTTFFSR